MSDNGDSGGDSDDRPRGVSLSLDTTLELLADHDRRTVLTYLMDDRAATVDELAEHLVARRTERTDERPDRDHVKSALHHVHVPKLAAAGVVDYDTRNRELRYWGSDRLETWHGHVERLRDH